MVYLVNFVLCLFYHDFKNFNSEENVNEDIVESFIFHGKVRRHNNADNCNFHQYISILNDKRANKEEC